MPGRFARGAGLGERGGDSGEACVAKQIDAKSQINLQAADQLPHSTRGDSTRLRRVAQSVARFAFMHNQQAGLTNGAAYISPAAGVPPSVCAGVCAIVCVCVRANTFIMQGNASSL